MCALTGPLAIVLTPISFLAWVETAIAGSSSHSTLWRALRFKVLILMAGRARRLKEPLGASLASLLEILSNHVFMAVLIGRNIYFHGHPLGALVVSVPGSATLLYGFYGVPQPLKLSSSSRAWS